MTTTRRCVSIPDHLRGIIMLSALLQNFFHFTKQPRARRQPWLSVELLEKREVLNAFTPGNLVILRAGDGSSYNGTAPLFLDEYTVNGTVVQTANIPNKQMVGGPGNQPITIDLSAAAGNGQLNRSYDG